MSPRRADLAPLSAHLDANGDLAPPWARFPGYERYTIGWRMGSGETWLGLWHDFLGTLGSFEERLAYLTRHPPAPSSWAGAVHHVLYPSSQGDEGEDEDEDDDDEDDDDGVRLRAKAIRDDLLARGLIASDIAYPTWLRQQDGVRWPWTYSDDATVEDIARHWTRDLSFWSRQVAALRTAPQWTPPQVPEAWRAVAGPLATGTAEPLDPARGLLSLARVLAAGHVTPPWQLGLTVDDFADSFEDDMGYVDAFRLWGMSVFDDRAHLQRYLDTTQMPDRWTPGSPSSGPSIDTGALRSWTWLHSSQRGSRGD